MNMEEANKLLDDKKPLETIDWALSLNRSSIVTTNFGPYEAVILHMLVQVKPDIQVVWIDSGYNTQKTYRFAEDLIGLLHLNIDIYTPKITTARRNAVMGGVPNIDNAAHAEFTEQFKLEPFNRAMQDYKPEIWFTAVRREQTAFRQSMDIVSEGPFGSTKVAPILGWQQADMQAYLDQHQLPNEINYYDPTKALANRECGLHTKVAASA